MSESDWLYQLEILCKKLQYGVDVISYKYSPEVKEYQDTLKVLCDWLEENGCPWHRGMRMMADRNPPARPYYHNTGEYYGWNTMLGGEVFHLSDLPVKVIGEEYSTFKTFPAAMKAAALAMQEVHPE